MNSIINLFINAQGPKLIRHLLVFVGTMLAAHGIQADTTDFASLITGVAACGLAVIWSHATHVAKVPDELMPMLASLAKTIGHQGMVVIAALLHTQGGIQGLPSSSAGVIVLILNFALSALHRPGVALKAEAADKV